ncbi:alkyl/aryl-sulfatase [Betaproteobacteria bacterium LSUCC0117]|nr:alkyl/aryl-sulfatase [Betaproteobacteria bacterium LSUCC0117]
MTPLEKLKAHSAEFRKDIVNPAPGVYVAVGYAASNVAMVETAAGLVIVDTSESTTAAENILSEFRKISSKPVHTIIVTHGHRDHLSGIRVFCEDGKPEIVARANMHNELVPPKVGVAPTQIRVKRAARQFGIPLQAHTERINIGLGPAERPIKGLGDGFIEPTRFFDGDALDLEIGGEHFELRAAPGESPDQLFVWMPERKILFAADNYYHSFPNLYAIRGTPYRDFTVWADTMERMHGLGAEVMCLGHSRPVIGAADIAERLGGYRDAIRHIVVETVKGMNAGLTPDELVEVVKLPAELAEKPFLVEYYGTVAFAVRAYFAGTLGWFDGNPTTLQPLSPKAQAERFASLAGGEDQLFAQLQVAAKDDPQWALQLADQVIQLGRHANAARRYKIDAMVRLADQTVNAPVRNYYLTCVKEMREALEAGA